MQAAYVETRSQAALQAVGAHRDLERRRQAVFHSSTPSFSSASSSSGSSVAQIKIVKVMLATTTTVMMVVMVVDAHY
jgi:hypothetical protein